MMRGPIVSTFVALAISLAPMSATASNFYEDMDSWRQRAYAELDVPRDLETLKEDYDSFWRRVEAGEGSVSEGDVQGALTSMADVRPVAVVKLDLVASVLREAPLGELRDKLAKRFLEDLDCRIRASDVSLRPWHLMEVMITAVRYPAHVEPSGYSEEVISRFREYANDQDERLALAACGALLVLAPDCPDRRTEIVEAVQERLPKEFGGKGPKSTLYDKSASTWLEPAWPGGLTWDEIRARIQGLEWSARTDDGLGIRVSEKAYRTIAGAPPDQILEMYLSEDVPAGRRAVAYDLLGRPSVKSAVAQRLIHHVRRTPGNNRRLWLLLAEPRLAGPRGAEDHEADAVLELIVQAIVESDVPDEVTPLSTSDERVGREWLGGVLHRMASGLSRPVSYATRPRSASVFEGASCYYGHAVAVERLLVYLEQPASLQQRIRAATYLDIAFEDFPETAQDVEVKLAALLPKLKGEYGLTGEHPQVETDEWRLVGLVEKQIENAARTVRYGKETGFLIPDAGEQ